MNPGDFDTFDSTVYAPQFMKQSKQVNSRLAKREQTKLARQTAVIIFTAIVLVIIFIFVALPAVIRFASDGTTTDSLQQSNQDIPPQTPSIGAPPAAVAEKKVVVSGYSEAESEVIAVINGEEGPRIFAGEDGAFELELPLNEGENTVSFYAQNSTGLESGLSRQYTVQALTTAPKLVVNEPQPDQIFETASNRSITINGETQPGSRVFLNDRLLITNAEGVFRGTHRLEEGNNELKFKVVDAAGNETEESFSVEFRY